MNRREFFISNIALLAGAITIPFISFKSEKTFAEDVKDFITEYNRLFQSFEDEREFVKAQSKYLVEKYNFDELFLFLTIMKMNPRVIMQLAKVQPNPTSVFGTLRTGIHLKGMRDNNPEVKEYFKNLQNEADKFKIQYPHIHEAIIKNAYSSTRA